MSHHQDRVVAELKNLAAHAAEAKAAVDGPYLTGYLTAMGHALDVVRGVTDTPAETPTARVLAEWADRRTT